MDAISSQHIGNELKIIDMISQFETLSDLERTLLLKAPVLVSVLASCSENKINETRRKDAIKLAHLKTFTSPPLLIPYYREVENNFAAEFDKTTERYFPFDAARRAELLLEIDKVNQLIGKLPEVYGKTLHLSLVGYAVHVKRSTHTVFQDFIFPLAYSRL